MKSINEIEEQIREKQHELENITPTLSNIYDTFKENYGKIIIDNSEIIREEIIKLLKKQVEIKEYNLRDLIIELLKIVSNIAKL